MKRNNLTTAVIAGIAGVAGIANMAGAVNLNPDGLGQVLIYPYFTVNANNQTLVSVVNTQNVGKAVKVRFLEGYDSREVLDFNLYLSPYDVWVAAVFDTAGINGAATDGSAPGGLLTPDNSCTDPGIKNATTVSLPTLPDGRNYVPFSNGAYAGLDPITGSIPLTDGGPTNLKRTRTGHIEMLEMATIGGDTLAGITHDSTGVPADCSVVIGLASGSGDLFPPTGGLFGSGSIVNAAQGTLYGYNADAVDGFYTTTGNIFNTPGSIFPDLTFGDNSNVTPAEAQSYVFNNGQLLTSTYPLNARGSINAVSSVFTADHIYNEFEIDPTSGSVASEWVVTFPTKRYYVDPALAGVPFAPFTKKFTSAGGGTACEPIGITTYNREEGTAKVRGGFSPPQPGTAGPSLCYEAQVITFGPAAAAGTASPVFGSPLTANIDPTSVGTTGWVNLDLTASAGHVTPASDELHVFHGLPVTGFLAKDFTNKNATPGVLGNYAGLYRHRTSRSCTTTNGACS